MQHIRLVDAQLTDEIMYSLGHDFDDSYVDSTCYDDGSIVLNDETDISHRKLISEVKEYMF